MSEIAAAEHCARLAKDRYDEAGVALSDAFDDLRAAYDALELACTAEAARLRRIHLRERAGR